MAPALHDQPAPHPALSLLEFASYSMAIELLPHRMPEIHHSFGLDERTALELVASYRAYFEAYPSEANEHAVMRARMRDRWIRWEREQQAAPVSTPASSSTSQPSSSSMPSTPGMPSVPSVPSVPSMYVAPSSRPPANDAHPVANGVARLDARKLCFADFASLTMGLEVHHEARESVYVSFRLLTTRQRRLEEKAWLRHLRENPDELARLRREREHTRAGWQRWQPLPPASAPVGAARRPYLPPAKFRAADIDAPLDLLVELALEAKKEHRTRLVLVELASLRLLIDETPHLRHLHGAAFGLGASEVDDEIAAWTAIMRERPEQAETYHRIREQLQSQRLRARDARESTLPPVARAAPSLAAMPGAEAAHRPVAAPAVKRLELFEYAVLCAELDRVGADVAQVAQRHGISSAPELAAVHDHWQNRFVAYPSERQEWFHQVQRLRLNWSRPIR